MRKQVQSASRKTVLYTVIAVLSMVSGVANLTAGQVTPLAGSSWRPVPLSGLAGADDARTFVAFGPGDGVSGFAGCNRFFGTFGQTGDRLVLSPLATTRKLCPPETMLKENKFLQLLKKTRRVAASLDELSLLSLEGIVFLRLEPVE